MRTNLRWAVMRSPIGQALLITLAALPAGAQSEEVLRQALVSKHVTVKLDLPASHQGVDLRFDREQPFDARENSSRIREHEVAIREGERSQISYVKVKGDMIELHLGGGGFNWISDTTTESFTAAPRSSREKDLEKQIKTESDSQRRRDMQDELSRLTHEREGRDERRRREVEDANVFAREHDRERAMRSGSRLNLRFKKQVPPDALTPEGLLRYVGPWVELEERRGDAGPRP